MGTITIDSLEALLSETPDAGDERAARSFDSLVGGRTVVVYGAGEAGRTAAAALTGAGRPPVGFADRAAAPGQTLNSIPVLRPDEAVAHWGSDAAFVVAVVNPGVRFADVNGDLVRLGCECVIGYPALGWRFPDVMLPRFAVGLPSTPLSAADQVLRAFALLSDDISRTEFIEQIRWRIDGDLAAVSAPHDDTAGQYFPDDLFALLPDEVFVDIGAYDGDTVRELVARTGGRFGRLLALEPDPANFEQLERTIAALAPGVSERTTAHAIAASDVAGTLRFGQTGTTSAAADENGDIEVSAERLDDLLANEDPTYLKLDVEGAEPLALMGATRTIASRRPILAVCVYHEPDHLWTLPLQVADMVGDGYRFHLRRYAADFFDEVLYAVPKERAA